MSENTCGDQERGVCSPSREEADGCGDEHQGWAMLDDALDCSHGSPILPQRDRDVKVFGALSRTRTCSVFLRREAHYPLWYEGLVGKPGVEPGRPAGIGF